MIDRLRELLLPTLALTILATLWTVAKVRVAEQDLDRPTRPSPSALLRQAQLAGVEPEADATAEADAARVDP